MSRIIFAALAVTTLLGPVLSAQAQTKAQQTTTRVFYGDLDLSKQAGVQTLMRRLKVASLQVCDDAREALRVNGNSQGRCTQDAVANALAKIGKIQSRVVAQNSEKPPL